MGMKDLMRRSLRAQRGNLTVLATLRLKQERIASLRSQ